MDAVSGADAILRKLMELEPQGAGPDGPGLLVRLWPYLETHGCETMVIEEHVVDEEYFREFLHFYATTFIEHPSTATRLHFFSANADAVEALLDPLSDGQIHAQEAYLGYTVLRPTSPLTVGETLLRIPADGTSGRCYTHCATRFGQTLRGRRLSVAAAPFIGQDQTGVCAHSAIWGAMKYLHKYRYYPKTSMPDIAMMATRGVLATRFTRPAEGLTDPQMYSVFLQMGFQIYYAELSPGNPALDSPLEVAYSCIESGLPAFLTLDVHDDKGRLVGGHAVWFTGHTFSPEKTATECELSTLASAAGELAYLSTRQWDDFLLTHDDNAGPYVPTTVAVDPNLSAGGPVYRVEYHGYHEHMQWPQSPYGTDQLVAAAVFAPLPEEVFIKPPDAKRMAIHAVAGGHLAGVLRNVRELYAAGDIEWPLPEETEAFLEAMQGDPRRYAYRTFLCLSARHQEHVVTCAAMPPEVKRAYTEHLRFPEYIWVTEISETAAMTSEAGHDRRVVGEVILDSTDSAALHTMHGFRYISLHVPGLLVTGADETGRQARTPSQSAGLRYWPVSVGGGYRPYDHNSRAEDTPRSHRQLGPISMGR